MTPLRRPGDDALNASFGVSMGRKRKESANDHRTLHIYQTTLSSGKMVGLSRFELLTPRLSSVCSNQLSYRPSSPPPQIAAALSPLSKNRSDPILSKLDRRARQQTNVVSLVNVHRTPPQIQRARSIPKIPLRDSRKEVIQPQVLLQLPCYDFTPITNHTLGACFPYGLAQRLLVQPAFVM